MPQRSILGRSPGRAPYRSEDMPLVAHSEAGSASVARARAASVTRTQVVAQRTPPRGSDAGPLGSGRRKNATPKKTRTPWQRARRGLWLLLGVLVVGPLVAFAIGWIVFPVPSPDAAALTQNATFTFSDGSPLAVLRPDNVNRTDVTLDKVPITVQNAVLAAEDRTFRTNPGFDIMGIGRAVFSQLTGGDGGGSTITQQYVKNATGQDQATLWRKYREAIISVKISKLETKDQILENYLNTIYFGRGAYGIEAASKAYFNTDVSRLTIAQGAMLAGIIQSPTGGDPANDLAQAKARWTYVINGMAQAGWITPAQRTQQVFPADWLRKAPTLSGVPNDDRYHIYNQAKTELTAAGITEDQITTDGLTVTTTIDPSRQKQAVDAVAATMNGQPADLRTALVSVDPRSGAIVAYDGGPQGLGTDYAQALRQPGSAFKPFVLSAALQAGNGVGLGTIYNGSSPQTIAGQVVHNSDGVNCDRCTVKTAMTDSINTIFYQIGIQAGVSKVADAAHQAGIPANLIPVADGGISLGDQEVHPADMASAYATFAADGVRHPPHIVAKVVAADGRVLLDNTAPSAGTQAVPQQVARNVTESMLEVAATSRIALTGDRPVAAKTGTVQLGSSNDNKDTWTVGYTPSLSTAVWVGTEQSDPVRTASGAPAYGRTLAGAVWQGFMNTTLKGTPVEQFSPFVPIGTPPTPPTSTYTAPPTTAPPTDPNGNGNNGGGQNGYYDPNTGIYYNPDGTTTAPTSSSGSGGNGGPNSGGG